MEYKRMNTRVLISALCATVVAAASATAQESSRSISAKEFQSPPAELSAFWFWNGDMQEAEMERQLMAFKEVGMRSVVFHPRSGMGGNFGGGEMDYYLTDEYFEKVRFGLDVCKRLDLKVILYDEYNWPSGYAGGRVLRGGEVGDRVIEANPEYAAKHLAVEDHVVSQGESREVVLSVPEGELVAAMAAQSRQDGALVRESFVDLRARISGGQLIWTAPSGDWRVLFFLQRDTDAPPGPGSTSEQLEDDPRFPDLLNPDAMAKFIDVTHQEYYDRFSPYFGNTITAVFTDEPGFSNNRIDGHLPNTVPWTERFPEVFRRKKGYDLVARLPQVWFGDDTDSVRVRADYWDVLSSLYMENYFGRIHQWCEAHGIESMGHVLEDNLRFHRTFEGGNFYKTMRYLDQAGIDQIGQRNMGLINPKLGSSAARLFNLDHTMSETFGAYGWGLTLEEMKSITNWHAVEGIDHEILHAFYYSIEGERKNESPPDLFYHQLWRDKFTGYTDYARRLLYLSDRGKQVVDIALLYPSTAIMTSGGISQFGGIQVLEEYLLTGSMALRAAQFDFNYVDELVLTEHPDFDVPVDLAAGQLRVGTHAYRVVVLPAVGAMTGKAARMLKAFAEQGGTVIALGRIPDVATDGDTEGLSEFVSSVFGPGGGSGKGVFVPVENMATGEELSRKPGSVIMATSIAQGQEMDYEASWVKSLVAAVRGRAKEDLVIGGLNPAIQFLHKRAEGKDWYLIVNSSEATQWQNLQFACGGEPVIWDMESGVRIRAKGFRRDGGRTHLPLPIPGYGAVGVVFGDEEGGATAELTEMGAASSAMVASMLALDDATSGELGRVVESDGEPIRLEGSWQLILEGEDASGAQQPLGSWADAWPKYSGTGTYTKSIDIPAEWLEGGRRIYLDLGEVRHMAEVSVNGQSAGVRLWRPYGFDITPNVRAGKNELHVAVTNTLVNRFGMGRPGKKADLTSGLLGPVVITTASASVQDAQRTTTGGGEQKPNIIVIFTDDMGFADLGCQGQLADLATPHIDRLASEGIRFTDGYVSAPQCSPSRAGLITGRYQQRFGLDQNGDVPLPAGETTIADRLTAAGYVTGMVGKWHLAPNALSTKWAAETGKRYKTSRNGRIAIPFKDQLPFYPRNRGFTETFDGNMNRYWATYSLDGKDLNPQGEWVIDRRYRLDVQSDAAVTFIQRNHDQPFFLYLPYFAPHMPLEAPEKYLSRFPGEMPQRRRYALAMISAMDDGVGRILDTLEKHELEEDTLIFFISDNGAPLKLTKVDNTIGTDFGGWNGSVNDPLVGEKGMLAEGGIRVPFVARWKGVLPEGRVYSQPVISLDIGATAVALAGLDQPEELDGVNLIPYLTGEKAGSPHDTLYWRFMNQGAIRQGKWKYLQAGRTGRFLFDLASPQHEKQNLIDSHPEIAAELQEDLNKWAATLKTPGISDGDLQGQEVGWYGHFFGNVPNPDLTPNYVPDKPSQVQDPRRQQRGGPRSSGQRNAKDRPQPAPTVGGDWVARQCNVSVKDGVLHAEMTGPSPLITTTRLGRLEQTGSLRIALKARSTQGGQGAIHWRTAGQSEFQADQVRAFTLPGGDAWSEVSVELSTDRKIIHVRLFLPADSGSVDIDSVEAFQVSGTDTKKLFVWDFESN